MSSIDMPGPDYVRVLAVLQKQDKQDWLPRLARNFLNGESWDIPLDGTGLPEEFILDRSFYAIALGSQKPEDIDFQRDSIKIDRADPASLRTVLGTLQPEKSSYFTIRGFVKVSGPGAAPPVLIGKKNRNQLRLYSDPSTSAVLIAPNDAPVGSIRDVQTKLHVADLSADGMDGHGVGVAIVDSGIFLPHIERAVAYPDKRRPEPKFPLPQRKAGDPPLLDLANSWRPHRLATRPGDHRIGHGTMCAYNVASIAPRATLLDYPSLISRSPGDHSVKGTIGAAINAYGKLLSFWIGNLLAGNSASYSSLVISNSWSIYHPSEEDFPAGHPGRYIDNANHPFHQLIWILAQLGVDIVFAAGNGGLPHPTPPFLHHTQGSIRGACAYPEVLTVGGCDVNDLRVGYSSQGPAITMFPGPTPDKPDLAAYTHFLGSQVFGSRGADGGTSVACPIAAGCVAALRTKWPSSTTSPAALFDALRQTARAGRGGGPGGTWNADYGYGIIDPVAAARHLNIP